GLRSAHRIPSLEPYSQFVPATMPFGGELMADAVATDVGANSVCDWVLVEVRSSVQPSQVLARRCALVQRDGDVVGSDGASPVGFESLPAGNYHIAIRHRNHLGVMTATPIALSSTTTRSEERRVGKE